MRRADWFPSKTTPIIWEQYSSVIQLYVRVHICKQRFSHPSGSARWRYTGICDLQRSLLWCIRKIHRQSVCHTAVAEIYLPMTHFVCQYGAWKSEGNNSVSWLLVSAAGGRRVFRSVGRQKWKYRFHFWADTTSGKYQIFLTSKGCSPVNKEKAACTSPANQVGRDRISFCSFCDI